VTTSLVLRPDQQNRFANHIINQLYFKQRSSYWHGCRRLSVCPSSVTDVMWLNGAK